MCPVDFHNRYRSTMAAESDYRIPNSLITAARMSRFEVARFLVPCGTEKQGRTALKTTRTTWHTNSHIGGAGFQFWLLPCIQLAKLEES